MRGVGVRRIQRSKRRNSHSNVRMLFLSPALGLGGVDSMISRVADLASLQDRIAVSIFAIQLNRVDLGPGSHERLEVLHSGRSRLIPSLPILLSHMSRIRPDVIVSSTPHLNVAAILARAFVSPHSRLVVWDHGVLPAKEEPNVPSSFGILTKLMKLLYRRADHLVCVSWSVLDDLQQRSITLPASVDVVPNFTDPVTDDSSEETPSSEFLLGVGRLAWEKGFDQLIEAFSQIQAPNLSLLIAGEGPEQSALRGQVARLGLNDRVKFLGHVKNVRPLMRWARLVVFPSRREGFPLALVEAMQEGAQIIVTDCPGSMREIVGDGLFGTITTSGKVADLAGSIASALKSKGFNPELVRRRGSEFTSLRIFPGLFRILLGASQGRLTSTRY